MRAFHVLSRSIKDVYHNGKGFFWLFILKTFLSSTKVFISAEFSRVLFNEILFGISFGRISQRLIVLVLVVLSIDVGVAFAYLLIDYYSEKSALNYNNNITIINSQK